MNASDAKDHAMHSRVSKEGRLLGKYMALLANEGRRRLDEVGILSLETPGSRGEMCASCACRDGTVPNGCAQTQMDLLKAVVEGGRFLCHAPNDGRMCAGFLAARAAHIAKPIPQPLQEHAAAWEYSPPDPTRPATPTQGDR